MNTRLTVTMTLLALFGATEVMAAPQTVTLPKGTSVQKMGAGYFRFMLPDGRRIEVRGLSPATGVIMGDTNVYDQSGKLSSSCRGGTLRGAGKLSKERASTLPRQDYVQIDDEVTWLPVTFQCEGKGATQLSPQPDPPGLHKPVKPQPVLPDGGKSKVVDPHPPGPVM
jgi:hypothetical protein